MHYLYDKKIHYHANLITLLKLELETLPKGSMKMSGGKYYYQVYQNSQKSITQNKKLIAQYCRKAIVLFLIKHLEKERTLPAHLHKKRSINDIIATLPAAYQNFPQHYYYHSQYNDWLKMKAPPTKFHAENQKYAIGDNQFVRSKSEMIITNLLKKYGIPFLYEVPFQTDGNNTYPDFLILCPYTGRLTVWEHFGLLNDPEYQKKMKNKIARYHQLGFKLFETVIYTFESDIAEPECINNLIEENILNPRL